MLFVRTSSQKRLHVTLSDVVEMIDQIYTLNLNMKMFEQKHYKMFTEKKLMFY